MGWKQEVNTITDKDVSGGQHTVLDTKEFIDQPLVGQLGEHRSDHVHPSIDDNERVKFTRYTTD